VRGRGMKRRGGGGAGGVGGCGVSRWGANASLPFIALSGLRLVGRIDS
jgi:hypothetical protein